MSYLTDHALAVAALWLAWEVAEIWVQGPPWAWYLVLAVVGCVIEWQVGDHWWLGVGLAGTAVLVKRLWDLVLVATDVAKVSVLRNRSR